MGPTGASWAAGLSIGLRAEFQIAYDRFQDNDEETWDNSAVVTLVDDGTIVVEYGTVRSEDLLIGVFDGTHTDNRSPALQGQYVLSQYGTGVILYDYWSSGGEEYDGALDNQTIVYLPWTSGPSGRGRCFDAAPSCVLSAGSGEQAPASDVEAGQQ